MMSKPATLDIRGYEIEGLIADGGMASVYLALQQSLRRPVALKILRKFDRPADAKRFLTEGRLIASLDHPNIITIHDIGVAADQHYISMEYLEGGSLEDRIRRGLPADEALGIAITIGTCLEFVHRKGIVHLDVKPANILFHPNGTLKLTDFGIARSLVVRGRSSKEATALGSPYYISPEQAQGLPLDGRADIYSLGIILYEMLTTRKPYQADSHMETIVAHVTRPLPSLPGDLAVFQEALAKMIAKKPEERFASAAEMVGYLKAMRWVMTATSATEGLKGAFGHGSAILPKGRFGGLKTGISRATRSFQARRLTRWAAVGAGCLVLLAGFRYTVRATGEVALAQPDEAEPRFRDFPVALADAPATNASGDPAPVATLENGSEPGTTANAPVSLPANRVAPPQPGASGAGAMGEVGRGSIANAGRALPGDHPHDSGGTQGPAVAGVQQRGKGGTAGQDLTEAEPGPTGQGGEPSIQLLLDQAKVALEDYRLMVPRNNSAFRLYSEVLAREPGRQEALDGLDKIAGRYAGLVQTAIDRGNHTKAETYLQRGLQVRGNHQRLLQLEAELRAREQELEAERQAEVLARREADLRARQEAAEPPEAPKKKGLFEKIRTIFAQP